MSKIFKAVFLKITFLDIDHYNSKRLNLHPISHRFEVIADYWSNLRFWQRGIPLWHTRLGWTLKLRTTKFSLKKLETLLYRMLFINLQIIISFCHNTVAMGEYRVKITVFNAGWVILTQNFTQKGTSPTNYFCIYTVGQKKLHHFIFAITLSKRFTVQ